MTRTARSTRSECAPSTAATRWSAESAPHFLGVSLRSGAWHSTQRNVPRKGMNDEWRSWLDEFLWTRKVLGVQPRD